MQGTRLKGPGTFKTMRPELVFGTLSDGRVAIHGPNGFQADLTREEAARLRNWLNEHLAEG